MSSHSRTGDLLGFEYKIDSSTVSAKEYNAELEAWSSYDVRYNSITMGAGNDKEMIFSAKQAIKATKNALGLN